MSPLLKPYPLKVTVRRSKRFPSRWIAKVGKVVLVSRCPTRKEAASLGLSSARQCYPGSAPFVKFPKLKR
jgi:hypothetical protein